MRSTIARSWCARATRTAFLPRCSRRQKYRRALYALYAFNLEVARIRELAREPMPGEIRLQWWRDVLRGAGQGEVDAHPVAAALRDVVVRYRLPPAALADLIDARTFDLYDEPMASARRSRSATPADIVRADRARRAILRDGQRAGAPATSSAMPASPMRSRACFVRCRCMPRAASSIVPADLMQRYGAQSERCFRRQRPPTELRAALAELRLRARQHLAAARDLARLARLRRCSGVAAGRAGAAGARPHGASKLSAVQAGRIAAMAAAVDACGAPAARPQRSCACSSDLNAGCVYSAATFRSRLFSAAHPPVEIGAARGR